MSEHLLVVGLGVTGEAVVREAARRGADVTIVEDRPRDEPEYRARVSAALAAGARVVETPAGEELDGLLTGVDVVVPSPGVPERHDLLARATATSVPVRSEIDLAAERLRDRGAVLVAITGTNGKTTVTTLVTDMLRASAIGALAAGNIGTALLDAAAGDERVVVAEVSSFQLRFTTLAFHPDVAVLLNIAEDHLDWHGDVGAYAAAKAQLFAHQTAEDALVFNADDPGVVTAVRAARASRVAFTLRGTAGEFAVRGGAVWTDDGARIVGLEELGDVAPHDLQNGLAAAAAALRAGGTLSAVAETLRDRRRLPHRVALVGEAGGVQYYDDSKATNPHATVHAVRAFSSVVLIAGGRNKGLDLGGLRTTVPTVHAVVAIGEAADEVERAFAGAVPVVRAGNMREAVSHAGALARTGDAVLLSPACASFDWYGSYAERGDDFAAEVRRLMGSGRVGIS